MKLLNYNVEVTDEFWDDPAGPGVMGGMSAMPSGSSKIVKGSLTFEVTEDDMEADSWDELWPDVHDTVQNEIQQREGIQVYLGQRWDVTADKILHNRDTGVSYEFPEDYGAGAKFTVKVDTTVNEQIDRMINDALSEATVTEAGYPGTLSDWEDLASSQGRGSSPSGVGDFAAWVGTRLSPDYQILSFRPAKSPSQMDANGLIEWSIEVESKATRDRFQLDIKSLPSFGRATESLEDDEVPSNMVKVYVNAGRYDGGIEGNVYEIPRELFDRITRIESAFVGHDKMRVFVGGSNEEELEGFPVVKKVTQEDFDDWLDVVPIILQNTGADFYIETLY